MEGNEISMGAISSPSRIILSLTKRYALKTSVTFPGDAVYNFNFCSPLSLYRINFIYSFYNLRVRFTLYFKHTLILMLVDAIHLPSSYPRDHMSLFTLVY